MVVRGTWVLGGHRGKDPETLEREASATPVSVGSCQATVPISELPSLLATMGGRPAVLVYLKLVPLGPWSLGSQALCTTLHVWSCMPHASVGRSGHPADPPFPQFLGLPLREASRLAPAQRRLLLAMCTRLLLGPAGLAPGPFPAGCPHRF